MSENIADLIGKTLTEVSVYPDQSRMVLVTSDGAEYALFHEQDCCEGVHVEEVIGDLGDLVGSPLVMAEESTNHDNPPQQADSWTWTFYKFATAKGYVTVRWLGESNGYYSESVSFARLTP
jgi:hypothetical protein